MENRLTLGSLFDGSGGFPLAGLLSGIEPVWASEIEPFPIRVTTKRMPFMKHYGDVSSISGADLEPVDIITWGSPCQDLSIAGKRAGLKGNRSGLYMEAVRIVKEMLEASDREYPKFCVFENVPGLLSSNKGDDFITCLDMMQDLGFIPDVNILDAQDMGVPQRRKRVYITWINADHILKKRTIISDSIILQLLTEILHLNLAALLRASGIVQKKSDVPELSLVEDSLRKRIKLFSLQKEDRLLKLQKYLDEIQAICSGEQRGLDSIAGEDLIMSLSSLEAILSENSSTGNPYMSIGLLLKNSLEESLQQMNGYTTSTQTRQITDQKIFTCLEGLLNTVSVTIRLMLLSSREPMSVNCFEWVKYDLTEVRGYINAALKDRKLAETMERHELLRLYKSELSRIEHSLERYFAEQCGREILPEFPGLFRYSAESFRSWQRAAGSLTEGSGEAGTVCLNDQGGRNMDVSDDVSGTLRSEMHGHAPVVTAGFCTEHSAKAHGIGYEEETSPTLRAGTVPAAIALEHNPTDSRIGIASEDKSQTLLSRMGTGGNNVPLVMQCFGICAKSSNSMMSDNPKSGFYEAETARTLDGNGGNPTCNQGGIAVVEGNGSRPSHHGDGYSEKDTMYTLNATETHGVAYGLDRASFNQGKNAKFGFIIEEEKEPTLVSRGPGAVAFADKASSLSAADGPKGPSSQMLGNPEENFIAEPKTLKIRCGKEGGGKGALVQYNKSATLATNNDQTLFEPTWSTSKNSYHTEASEEVAGTLVATDYKDPPLINDTDGIEYIVRRLTPTECARLQGFPDWWCSDLGTEEPTEEDIVFWTDVFETHRSVVTHAAKPKTRAQIIRWLKDPHTDSAEYKMWGNGISLPNAVFVLAGIAWADGGSE